MNYTLECNASSVPPMEVSPIPATETSMGQYSYNVPGFNPGIVYQCTIYANTSIGAGPVASATGRTLEERKSDLIVIH